MSRARQAHVGLGANLGERARNLVRAVELLDGLPGAAVRAASSVRETAPVDAPPPPYLNAVVALETVLRPDDLLERLLAIERRLGRSRDDEEGRGAPRPIDLDLLLHEEPASAGRARVPHPRLTERRFVLEPLVELVPGLVVPGTGRTIRAHLDALGTEVAT